MAALTVRVASSGVPGRPLAALAGYLRACGVTVEETDVSDAAVADGAVDAVVVWSDRPLPGGQLGPRRTPLLLAGPTLDAWRHTGGVVDAAGLLPGGVTPVHEIRVRPTGPAGFRDRFGAEVYVADAVTAVDKVIDDVQVLLAAHLGLAEHPVLTWRPATRVGVLSLGRSEPAREAPELHRAVFRWLRHATGRSDGPAIGVGMLGFGAIGEEHAAAAEAVTGLRLAAVCDRNPARLAAARRSAPEARAHDDGDALLADPDVDLVVVSTPPDAHAHWAVRALRAGKSVLVEKPFAVSLDDVDQMMTAAERNERVLTVYQNRRWDADYVTLRRLVRDGALGEVFHYESFVGGYAHPCNYWHSDVDVSGGAVYDWGSHYVDWMLDLLPGRVRTVAAVTHKRVWHDVTNADHTRVAVGFDEGLDAQFVHSDVAAAAKPKWYVLGTRGALVGQWRDPALLSRSPAGLAEERFAPADLPATLHLHTPDGSVTTVRNDVVAPYTFHRQLADHLLSGTPLQVTAHQARRTVAVLAAATVSAAQGGRPVDLFDR